MTDYSWSFLQTEAELIDWYPGSSVLKMGQDVERLAKLAENKQVQFSRNIKIVNVSKSALKKNVGQLLKQAIF
jgi:hypothetical protein